MGSIRVLETCFVGCWFLVAVAWTIASLETLRLPAFGFLFLKVFCEDHFQFEKQTCTQKRKKGVFCCHTLRLGGLVFCFLPTTGSHPLEGWEELWSSPQRSWCCTHKNVACEDFDCNFQLSSLEDQSSLQTGRLGGGG